LVRNEDMSLAQEGGRADYSRASVCITLSESFHIKRRKA
jgi:hypothetical protein